MNELNGVWGLESGMSKKCRHCNRAGICSKVSFMSKRISAFNTGQRENKYGSCSLYLPWLYEGLFILSVLLPAPPEAFEEPLA